MIREVVQECGGNQVAAAKALSVDQGQISRWINEKQTPKVEEIARVASERRKSCTWILTGQLPESLQEPEAALELALDTAKAELRQQVLLAVDQALASGPMARGGAVIGSGATAGKSGVPGRLPGDEEEEDLAEVLRKRQPPAEPRRRRPASGPG